MLIALTCPAVRAWDPAFGYEMAAIIEHGVEEMWGQDKDVIYYISAYNGNYPMPAKPEGIDEGLFKGLYKFQEAPKLENQVRLLGSGAIMAEVLGAAEMLAEYGVGAEVWSVTSYGELQRNAVECDRLARLRPGESPPTSWVSQCLGDGVVTVAASDNMMALPLLIDKYVGGEYIVLGTDGFGRSDTRQALRRYFEVDKEHIVMGALSGLAKAGRLPASVPAEARAKFGFAVDRADICSF